MINLIDVICCAFILLMGFLGLKSGFFKVMLKIAVYILSYAGARLAGAPVAGFLYDALLKDKITVTLTNLLPAGGVGGTLAELTSSLTESLPEGVVNIASFFNLMPTSDTYSQMGSILTVDMIRDTYIQPIITKILVIITQAAIFLLLSVILGALARLIRKLFRGKKKKKGLLGKFDSILGGILGLIKGIIPAGVVCALINLIAPLINNPAFVSMVSASKICSFVANLF